MSLLPKHLQSLGNDRRLLHLSWIDDTGIWVWIPAWFYETRTEAITKTENNNHSFEGLVPHNWMPEVFQSLSREYPIEKCSLKSPPRRMTLRSWMCSEQVFRQVLPTGSCMPGDSLASILKPSKTRLASGIWESSINRGGTYQLSQTNMLLYICMWKSFTTDGPIA